MALRLELMLLGELVGWRVLMLYIIFCLRSALWNWK